MSGSRNGEKPGVTAQEAAFHIPGPRTGGIPGGDIWAVPPIPADRLAVRALPDVTFADVLGLEIQRTPLYGEDNGERMRLTLRKEQVVVRVYNPGTYRAGPVARAYHSSRDDSVDVEAAAILITQVKRYMEQRVAMQELSAQGRKYPGFLLVGTDSVAVKDRLLEMADDTSAGGIKNYIGNNTLIETADLATGDDPDQRRFSFHTDIFPSASTTFA